MTKRRMAKRRPSQLPRPLSFVNQGFVIRISGPGATLPNQNSPSCLTAVPALCLGLGLVAVCLLVPQAEANRRLVVDRDQLRLDVAHADAQLAANDVFLSAAGTDPELAERLAQRQMRQIRRGATALPLGGAGVSAVTTVTDLVRVPEPPPVPAYVPPPDVLSQLTRTPRRQLCGLGGGLCLIAIGLVAGGSAGRVAK